MKFNSEINLKQNDMPESTGLFKQAEEFETKLREENMSLYRKLKLQILLSTQRMISQKPWMLNKSDNRLRSTLLR